MIPRQLQRLNGKPSMPHARERTSDQSGGDLSNHLVNMSAHSEQRRDRDQQILDRLANIEHKVDSFDQTQAFALRADAKKHLDEVKKIFGDRRRRAQVYLATDGSRSVTEIADYLGMQRQNVGPELKHLGIEGILELIDSRAGRDIWAKKAVDRTLRITKFLCEEFSLQENGLPKDVKKKNARPK